VTDFVINVFNALGRNRSLKIVLTFLLGASFSVAAGVSLAGQLFNHRPEVDRLARRRLVDRVHAGWLAWQSRQGGVARAVPCGPGVRTWL
jgi:hypothetical protein